MPEQTARPAARHTPTPWVAVGSHIYAGQLIVADTMCGWASSNEIPEQSERLANVELICRAVNHHEALVAALRDAVATVEAMYDPADDDDPAPAVLAQWKDLIRRATHD